MSTSTERDENTQAASPGGIAAITLFVEDLAAATRFYSNIFQLPVVFEDDNSTVFRFGDTLVNLLEASEVPALIAPAPVATPDGGVRFQLTLGVDDVDADGRRTEEPRSRTAERADGSSLGDPHRQLPRSGRSHLGGRPLASPVSKTHSVRCSQLRRDGSASASASGSTPRRWPSRRRRAASGVGGLHPRPVFDHDLELGVVRVGDAAVEEAGALLARRARRARARPRVRRAPRRSSGRISRRRDRCAQYAGGAASAAPRSHLVRAASAVVHLTPAVPPCRPQARWCRRPARFNARMRRTAGLRPTETTGRTALQPRRAPVTHRPARTRPERAPLTPCSVRCPSSCCRVRRSIVRVSDYSGLLERSTYHGDRVR